MQPCLCIVSQTGAADSSLAEHSRVQREHLGSQQEHRESLLLLGHLRTNRKDRERGRRRAGLERASRRRQASRGRASRKQAPSRGCVCNDKGPGITNNFQIQADSLSFKISVHGLMFRGCFSVWQGGSPWGSNDSNKQHKAGVKKKTHRSLQDGSRLASWEHVSSRHDISWPASSRLNSSRS